MGKRNLWIVVLITITISTVTQAQHVTERNYERAMQFLYPNADSLVYRSEVNPNWDEEAPVFWYSIDTRPGTEYFLVHADEEIKEPLFDHEIFVKNLSDLVNEEVNLYDLNLNNLQYDHENNTITFDRNNKTWTADLQTQEIKETSKEEEKSGSDFSSESPDGKWTVTRRDYNLWLKNNESGEEFQLTEDGNEKEIYGANLPWVWKKQEGPTVGERDSLQLSIEWAEDSKKFISNKLDIREAKLMYLLQHVPEDDFRAQVYSYYRALPGDSAVAKDNPYVFDVEQKTKKRLQIVQYDDLQNGIWNWYGDESNNLYSLLFERGFGSVHFLRANPKTGIVDTVFTEKSETTFYLHKMDWELLPKTNEVLWLSERDGWNHIYLYDFETGDVKQQVTKGDFAVNSIEHIDEENRTVFFTAGGRESNRDPYLPHLYSVNFDGSNLKLLTPENAFHNIHFSSDHQYFVDNFSRVDMKPQSILRKSSDGSLVMNLETADMENLLSTGWKYPEPFVLKARDNKTDIYGVIYRPTNFDPNNKYPVIDGTYSGPQAVRTPKSFTAGYRNSSQSLAELGFIVINVDGLGTSGRSKKFQDHSWKNLGDIGGPDHIKAIRELAEKYSYMDTTRVGIYGHSAGGYDAARAILKYPDFYKVAVSSAGNHDHRVAKAWWPEQYMGYPVGPQYEEQSNINLAKNLKGKLLLAHGDMDDNVHPAETLRMADALIKAGKDFDMLIMPNKTHRLGSENHYFTIKLWNYFIEHLMGAEPIWHYASYKDSN